ncbi:septum site-determining protein MinC [Roseibium denhamense]|uniref:Probable septum site-determining protein MinC n=1 Tax=Roseibium denhamense TaxID=76305 RepID=A0ABY1P776_9HYPH|nr:septum site-determining protein MinC [Roseibium denhamense]SMP26793.1 septum site-determining protein MinC [Roseibium denhamense]
MKFKGKSFIAIVLSPASPYDAWFAEIDRIIARTPGFFIDRPIVLDVRGTNIAIEDLETVLAGLAERSVKVFGIDGIAGTRLKPGMPPSFGGGRLTAEVDVPQPADCGSGTGEDADKKAAKTDENTGEGGLPKKDGAPGKDVSAVQSDDAPGDAPRRAGAAIKKDNGTAGKAKGDSSEPAPNAPAGTKASEAKNGPADTETSAGKSGGIPKQGGLAGPASVASGSSIVITEPVRSGQSVLHPDGDVTVIGSVSSGAEIIAGGSIHIYGALRGRALAGVAGKDCARIFCTKLDAELVSINGLYKVADDFNADFKNAPAQIRFENETLVFEELN